MSGVLDDVDLLLGPASGDVREVYDRVAGRYEHFRELWLKLAGRTAEEAMIEDLRAVLRPGARVLDAGCGTGALARQVLELEPEAELALLDLSPAMLEQAGDLPGGHVLGSVLDLPFDAGRFDVVVSAWVIETVPDPMRAVQEYLRVLTPSGQVLYSFCSLPDGWVSRAGSAWLRAAVRHGFAGEFLPVERIPWHGCERSHRSRFAGGLTSVISLRTCCTVAPPVLPDPPGRLVIPVPCPE